LKAGDKVLLIYEGGSILNPYIIGKLWGELDWLQMNRYLEQILTTHLK
jgi:hypothetical protein